MEFTFEKSYIPGLGQIFKPILRVKITGPSRSVEALMLLDSGADISFIPYSIGEAIGLEIDFAKRSEVRGIGEGSVPYILANITLSIGDIEIPVRIGWALIEEVPLLLGRLDIFQQLSIEFREFENKIIVNPANPSA
jgi:hypothetical protein